MPAVTPDQIEAAIYAPAPGQVERFLDFEWLVPVLSGQIWGLYETPPYTTDYLFTRPERFEPLRAENQRGKAFEAAPYPLTTPDGWNIIRPMKYQPAIEHCQLVPTSGRAVFERIAFRGDYHTIHINSGCGTYDDAQLNGELRMPCGWTPLWLDGMDPRPGTRILPAQSIAEIHCFMRQALLTSEFTHRLEYVDGELAAIYEGKNINGKPASQAFTLVTPQSNPRDFGPDVSEILCGGMMAYMLDSSRSTLEHNFHEGTRAHLRERTPDIIREIDEILKMVDPSTEQVLPEYFRHGFAPSFVKTKPWVISQGWLHETRKMFVAFAA